MKQQTKTMIQVSYHVNLIGKDRQGSASILEVGEERQWRCGVRQTLNQTHTTTNAKYKAPLTRWRWMATYTLARSNIAANGEAYLPKGLAPPCQS